MPVNTYGRQVVLPVTNKSGGAIIAGDVVVVDTANNDAFTTTTTAATTNIVGVAQESIASNATGRVLFAGYAALVNVNASVTRGHYGATHTAAKQAASLGASRAAGSFCQFLTGGTTPDAVVFPTDLGGGTGLTDPMTTRGDIIVRNASNVTARLALPATGKVFASDGSDVIGKYPPGYEFDAVEHAGVGVTATSAGTATTVITANAVTFDGSTRICLEFFSPHIQPSDGTGARTLYFLVYDGGSNAYAIGDFYSPNAVTVLAGVMSVCFTPSAAAHTYSVRAYLSSGGGATAYVVASSAGGSSANRLRLLAA